VNLTLVWIGDRDRGARLRLAQIVSTDCETRNKRGENSRASSSFRYHVSVSASRPADVSPSAGPPPPRAPVFEIRGLSKTYRMGEVEVQALRGVDLDVFAGEFLVLLGHSGSGKSTLLNIVGGLDTCTSGTVNYRGRALTAVADTELTLFRRDYVGFVFQFYNLIPSLTARENVQLVTDIADHPMTAEQALGLVGLTDRLDHFPAQLSGGEQQRVAIARAIAKRPDVLLCDEPTGALDITTGVTVLRAIARVNEDLRTTVVVITHNAAISEMADRVVTLSDGRIVGERRNAARQPVENIRW
jgi:putative ABC transport system ATP-binding protein